jgi:hypothetical protein
MHMHDAGLASALVLAVGVCLASVLSASAYAGTLAFSDVSARVVVGVHVSEAALTEWLPRGWHISTVGGGPSTGANLFLGFVDRLLNVDPTGQPIGSGVDRFVGLVVPARPPGAGDPMNVVIRIYHNAGMLPGAYKNSRSTSITRSHTAEARDTNPANGSESWEVTDGARGTMSLRFGYHGGPPVRAKQEQKFYSAIDPGFYRVYRFEQVSDLVRSTAAGVDRVQDFWFAVTIAELQNLFDGSHQVVSVTVVSWNSRQVFLP